MKNTLFLFLLSCSLFACGGHISDSYATDNPLETRVDRVVHDCAMEIMDDGPMMGLSLGIVANNEVQFYNYGSTEAGANRLPTSKTIYEIGSVTKTFTGILLARAVLEKKVHLDDDIRSYLEGNFENLEYEGMPIRVIDLANHTSGLPEDLLPEELLGLESPTMFDIVGLFEGDDGSMFLRDLHDVTIETTPGEQEQYSNAGMIVLGIVLENAYGLSYSDLIARNFTRPFDMKDTETVFFESHTADYTRGYDRGGNVMPHITLQIAGAAGGLKSTTHDMTKYISENIDESDEAIKLSHQSTHEMGEEGIGLGWKIRRGSRGDTQLWHDGGEPGFSSYCVIVPQRKLGIICLANQSGRQFQLTEMSAKIIDALEES